MVAFFILKLESVFKVIRGEIQQSCGLTEYGDAAGSVFSVEK